MSISVGDKLGPYEVLALIGSGGMGEVFRARDTRLNRDVAIKTSAERFSERFEREARVIASLNHPNICTLHDVGPNYLVMELVEGPTLAERIRDGAIPLAETLNIARQMADALEAAHEKGIVHRDLKPGNVKIKPDGTVKVLDFGLAKTGGTPALPSDNSPTLTISQTEAGMILGTAAYMAPEQAKGKPVDRRADIWAFGVVLYEMVTAHRLFSGETATEVMAAVIEREPKWDRVPPQVQRLLRMCLEKDPQKRLRHIANVMALVDDAPPAAAQPASRVRWLRPAVVAACVIAAGAALFLWAPWRTPAPTESVRFEVLPAEKMTFINQAAMAVSPDGRWMVFPARGEDGVARYYIRALNGVEVRALPGTEAVANYPPASWSYDSRWVVFAWGADRKLKKVDIQGGPPQNIADFPGFLSGAGWNSDGVIIAGWGGPILRVPASGGQTTAVTALAPGETAHRWPQFLPDGKHFLYLRVFPDAPKTGVYIGSIDAQPNQQSMQRLLASDRQASYAPLPGSSTGHLIFMRGTTLMAQSFDPGRMILSGEPTAIADGVDSFSSTGHGLFTVSDTGTLVYRGGTGEQTFLRWFDQQGNPADTIGDAGDYSSPAISPDGGRVAVAMGPEATRDIWILDVPRGASTRFTFDSTRDDYPAWSPDGKYIAFSSNRDGRMNLYAKPADGSGEEKLLLKTDQPKTVSRWTKDGRFLLFTSTNANANDDLWALPVPGESKAVPLLQTQFRELYGRVSPDGRWLAYTSTESGFLETYVRPFTPDAPAGTGAKWLVSKGGGVRPIWRADGKELFYLMLGGEAMAVDIDTSKGFQAGTPRRIFNAPTAAAQATGWDLAPDGKRFLFVAPPGAGRVIPFTVVLNWAAALKK